MAEPINIDNVRALNNLQLASMYVIYIPDFYGEGDDTNLKFTITAREANIPGKTKTGIAFRFLNKQIILPGGTEYDGEWAVTMVLNEGHEVYDEINKWVYDVDTSPLLRTVKKDAYIFLLKTDGNTINKAFKLIGLFPKTKLPVEALSQEGTDTHVTYEITFAYDDIDYDEDNLILDLFPQLESIV